MSKKKIAYARRTLLDPEEEDEQLPFEPRGIVVHTDYWVNRDYTLADVIGRGKFGEVRKCKETKTGRLLAAKTIVCRNKEQLDSALREIDVMSCLRHPKVLMIYDAFQNGKAVCIVTELIEGGELFDKIVDSNFDLTERMAILFMRQIVDGVAYIHSQNVIHLDLKPENIICVSKSSTRVKIIDLGLSIKYNKSVPQRALAGTVDFMSPEVVNYEAVSPASDMWSIGVICYVLVSGLSPFVGETDAETLCNITRCVFDYDEEEFTEITEACKDFINKLIVKDPRKRLTAVEAFNHSWLQKITRAQTMKHLSKKHHFRFFAKRKWHKAFAAIIAINRLERLGRSHSAVLAEIASKMTREKQRVPDITCRNGVVLPALRSAGVLTPGFRSQLSAESAKKHNFEFEKPLTSGRSQLEKIPECTVTPPSQAAAVAVTGTSAKSDNTEQPSNVKNDEEQCAVPLRHSEPVARRPLSERSVDSADDSRHVSARRGGDSSGASKSGGSAAAERNSPARSAILADGEASDGARGRVRSSDRGSGHRPRSDKAVDAASAIEARQESPFSGLGRDHADGWRCERSSGVLGSAPRTSSAPMGAEERRRRIAAILNDDDSFLEKPYSTRTPARGSSGEGARSGFLGAAMPKHDVQRLERLRKILETS